MTAIAGRRGQPVIALAALLVCWLGLRLLGFGDAVVQQIAASQRAAQQLASTTEPAVARPSNKLVKVRRAGIRHGGAPAPPRAARVIWMRGASPAVEPQPEPQPAPSVPVAGAAIWGKAGRAGQRWSGDAWLLGRNGAGVPSGAGPFYGSSQVGAVVRYRLALESRYQPTLYLRAAAALAPAPEQDLAAGLAMRPSLALPLAVGIEARLTRNRAATKLRPALVAVTTLPPQPLPHGFVAELYAQGGWIGGKNADVFGDLQLRAERPAGPAGDWQSRLGVGLWAAGQRGAGRVDLGPVASIAGPIAGGTAVRIELDWRLRVAGNAAPGSGPALVLASSF